MIIITIGCACELDLVIIRGDEYPTTTMVAIMISLCVRARKGSMIGNKTPRN